MAVEREETTTTTATGEWHAISAEEVFTDLEATASGLAGEEASERKVRYGPNRLKPPARRSALSRFASQFNNVLIFVLLGAAVVTAGLAHWVDSGVIVGVVLLNAIIGFIQEGKAERAMDAIRGMLSQKALVLRDGHKVEVGSEDLVPGDVVFLQSGDKVPADLRLFRGRDLRIDESVLTGESVPVEKNTSPVSRQATVGDRRCMAYSGTLVTYGQGVGVVAATAQATEIGRISELLGTVKPLTTRLLVRIGEFGHFLTYAILALAAASFAFGMLIRGYSATDMFLASVGLAVAAIPEGLPAIITITLAIGVQRMARRRAIIRRLPAVETLGSVTVVCSDKTGTLTRNEMTVKTVITGRRVCEVSGSGYDPHGGFSVNGTEVSAEGQSVLGELARASLLCNDSTVTAGEDGGWTLTGDPTEGALVTLGMKAGLDPATVEKEYPRTDSIPFESEHRFMATLHHDHAGHGFVYIKGAPERVLEMCHTQRDIGAESPLDRDWWRVRVDEAAARGERLIAVAFKTAEIGKNTLNFPDVEGGLTLLGVFGIIDPPREEAIKSVADCRAAGIRVKMITGDHAVTACAIGARMGIGDGITSVTGRDLDAMDDAVLRVRVEDTDVFARVSPEHKLRLVRALQANGEVTAMTGDGVNDAPALKMADVGVAMGLKGTEVARESAEMVLADDNFASIAHAVEEGRTVYDNIKKAITFILPTNAAEAAIILAAIISGSMLPITPVQILWVNMITAVTLGLALAFEPPESDVMKRPPRDPAEPLLTQFILWRVVFVAAFMVMATFGLFLRDRLQGVSIEEARTVAVNTIILFEVFYLFNTRYLRRSVLSREGLFGNPFVLGAVGVILLMQVLFTYTGPMQTLFGTAPVKPLDWVRILVVSSSVFFLVEGEKYMSRRLRRKAGAGAADAVKKGGR